jgi:selenocysteine-specific elongation factor
MAIAADDGVMPQTREHAAVLRALGVVHGVVAITKCDGRDPTAAVSAARRLLPGAEVVTCSARTGQGVADVVAALARAAVRVRSRTSTTTPVVLHADRVFTMRGAGTVLTGTLWSGTIGRGDMLSLLPAGRGLRVCGVHVHGEAVAQAAAGERVAVNLAGVAVTSVSRGDALVSPDAPVRVTRVLDVTLALEEAAGPPPRRVQVHHATRAVPGRPVALAGRYWQLRLEQPLLGRRRRPARHPSDRPA